MKIGFDVSQTGRTKAGCGYFADAMIRALIASGSGHAFHVYPDFGDFFFDREVVDTFTARGADVRFGPTHLTRESAARFWTAPELDAALGYPDIVHANNFWCPVQSLAGRVIYTLYDLGFLLQPWWTTEENRLGCMDGVFRAATAADWIVSISEASRRDFLATFPAFPADRIRVIHPCSRFDATDRAGQRPSAVDAAVAGRFWLNVGTIEPRKNQKRLAEAYARYLADGGEPMPLVLAGGKGWLMDDFRHHLERLGVAGRIVLTGYVSDDELVWLYRHCYANLYPSLFEGFGLPVLEGMQFGAPTITSASSSIPEVAGDAAILLDPEDTSAWAAAMLQLSRDPRQREQLGRQALSRAASFDWMRSSRALLALYDEAARTPKRHAPACESASLALPKAA
ncbi:MAG TPA: glycosyltransferase family 1 protein [Burkholderiaceae bacterium]|nr:glycosyltransferase family 1 protein [Burkholderiaceae bacterium]